MRKLLLASTLAALLTLAEQAHAADQYALWNDVGGWKITGKDNHCMMTGVYLNHKAVVLSADSVVGTLLIVAGKNWKGRWHTRQPVAVELYFDGNHQAKTAMALQDGSIAMPLSGQGVREFMAARFHGETRG